MNWCWLIGHYPIGPIETPIMMKKKFYVYKCNRCKKLIVFDSDHRGGWKEWNETE